MASLTEWARKKMEEFTGMTPTKPPVDMSGKPYPINTFTEERAKKLEKAAGIGGPETHPDSPHSEAKPL